MSSVAIAKEDRTIPQSPTPAIEQSEQSEQSNNFKSPTPAIDQSDQSQQSNNFKSPTPAIEQSEQSEQSNNFKSPTPAIEQSEQSTNLNNPNNRTIRTIEQSEQSEQSNNPSMSKAIDHIVSSFLRQVLLQMKAMGLSQTELAQRMHVSRPYISKVLKGDVNISFGTAAKLAHALALDFSPELKPMRDPGELTECSNV